MPFDRESAVTRLRDLQRRIRDAVIGSRGDTSADVARTSAADTIYGIDAAIEPVVEAFCEEWGRELPMVVVAEGLEPETGRVFPAGRAEGDAVARVILDPIDGTRGLMYDKRSAWSLAGVAANKGAGTRLADIEVAVMTELPTSKMGWSDVLWAVKGGGAQGVRERVERESAPGRAPQAGRLQEASGGIALQIAPSRATTIAHGFASVASFFPGTKRLAAELMETICARLLGPADVKAAAVFDDQYISTGGQFYELIVGHDRFIADLRPLFYAVQGQAEGLCCHPYDCAAALIATEAGVVLTDGLGGALDGPMDVTSGVAWAGYANEGIRGAVEAIVREFFGSRGIRAV
ncbi:MAG TPA: hypothetical protein VEA69_05405 [Tepidisphaeraceae bacterium]|nr:hypothetical protein [Tepidisphaeraceae bacterium]